MPQSYPINLDVTGRTVLVVGGGGVAARKARGLIEAGAGCVRCVAPEFCDEFPHQAERVHDVYRAEHLTGATLVFAATDRADVNEAVVRDAHERNLLVNRADADEEEPGDFSVPARLRRGEVTIAVSACSPALASRIRDRLATLFVPGWEQMADAMKDLRPAIKSARIDIAGRRAIFRELASDEALDVLAKQGRDGLRAWLLARYPELNHVL